MFAVLGESSGNGGLYQGCESTKGECPAAWRSLGKAPYIRGHWSLKDE